jgi:uncharacterized protein involved in copper resistance
MAGMRAWITVLCNMSRKNPKVTAQADGPTLRPLLLPGQKQLSYADLHSLEPQKDTRAPERTIEVRLGGNMGHEELINYMVASEIDGADTSDGALATWDAFGWIGGDYHKFWWRTEGERRAGETEEAEFWALYSRNAADF